MERQADWDKIIIGIDPGTNVMGYGILGVRQRKPEPDCHGRDYAQQV